MAHFPFCRVQGVDERPPEKEEGQHLAGLGKVPSVQWVRTLPAHHMASEMLGKDWVSPALTEQTKCAC